MLSEILAKYLEHFPAERSKLKRLTRQIASHEKLDDRHNFQGHITGSAIVLSPNRSKVLLIHHRAFGRWQQPGGHWEASDADSLAAARRETIEETGVELGMYLPLDAAAPLVPIDIDTHLVPERKYKNEPSHYHHDFRYLFVALSELLYHQEEEVHNAGWFAFNAPECAQVKQILEKVERAMLI